MKENLGSQLGRAAAELATWKQKYEVEGVQRAEELEVAKLKLQVRITDNINVDMYYGTTGKAGRVRVHHGAAAQQAAAVGEVKGLQPEGER